MFARRYMYFQDLIPLQLFLVDVEVLPCAGRLQPNFGDSVKFQRKLISIVW